MVTTDLRLRTLHSWPQYWDASRRVWVSVDPTWGRTTQGVDYFSKLDFNHLAFITHGLSDSLPVPNFQDIQVSYGSYHDYLTRPLITKWQPPLFILPFIPGTFRLQITNPNSQAVYSNPVTLPPYGSKVLTVQYTLTHPFDFSPKSVTLINMTYNIPQLYFFLANWLCSLYLTYPYRREYISSKTYPATPSTSVKPTGCVSASAHIFSPR